MSVKSLLTEIRLRLAQAPSRAGKCRRDGNDSTDTASTAHEPAAPRSPTNTSNHRFDNALDIGNESHGSY